MIVVAGSSPLHYLILLVGGREWKARPWLPRPPASFAAMLLLHGKSLWLLMTLVPKGRKKVAGGKPRSGAATGTVDRFKAPRQGRESVFCGPSGAEYSLRIDPVAAPLRGLPPATFGCASGAWIAVISIIAGAPRAVSMPRMTAKRAKAGVDRVNGVH
ncbi:MAG TPA: hypothetical protein VEK57_15430 [Thermoanaerobaculia bacterium]|nr:hypothetical protein [Thermoanaerobaculia bacterium]